MTHYSEGSTSTAALTQLSILEAGPPAFQDYLGLPKEFGGPDSGHLIRLGREMAASSHMPHVLRAAAAALREGVLFAPFRTEESVLPGGQRTGDLTTLDETQSWYETSVQQGWRQLDTGMLPPAYQLMVLETRWEAEYGNVYKDLICGEVTAQTLRELAEGHLRLARYIAKLEIGPEISRNGLNKLCGKLLLALSGLQQPQPVIFMPAPPRSSRRHGRSRRPQGQLKERSGKANPKVYDMVPFQHEDTVEAYRPIVPIQLCDIKRAHDNPSNVMLLGLRTQLGLWRDEAFELLSEVSRSQGRNRALHNLWGIVAARLPQFRQAREAFPAIRTLLDDEKSV